MPLLSGAGAVERGDGGVEQRHVDGLAQIPQLLRHGIRGGRRARGGKFLEARAGS
uniref:Uncharacterized protein n=1 Tax=Arundo donax TaxID=35708 RepID=A0A0A9H6F8_ARUDO